MTLNMQKQVTNRVISPCIKELQPNEIFVFGSNLEGQHGGGAALLAYKNGEPFGDKVPACRGRPMAFRRCKGVSKRLLLTWMNLSGLPKSIRS